VEEIQQVRILRAMAEVSAGRDVHSVTVGHIVARAGVSRRTFYELFADREDCFLATFEWGVRRAGVVMGDAYTRESRWSEGIRAALTSLLALLEEEPALARLCVVDALGGGGRILKRRAEALAVACEYVDRGRLESLAKAEPPEVTAEGVVGAVLAVIHARLLARTPNGWEDEQQPEAPEAPLIDLLGSLMSLILLPYLGAGAVRRELKRPTPQPPVIPQNAARTPVEGLSMRLTYRTARVLTAIAEVPEASNREVADRAGIVDQGQISRLLGRLEGLGLIANVGDGAERGAPNAWMLTSKGEQVEGNIHIRSGRPPRSVR
jgi:AcrR family transcriptional regulator